MKIHILVLAIAAAMVLSVLSGCPKLGEKRIVDAPLPKDKAQAQADITLNEQEIVKLQATVQQLDAFKIAFPALDNKGTAKAIADANMYVGFHEKRVERVKAILPTLPDAQPITASGANGPGVSITTTPGVVLENPTVPPSPAK